MSYKKHINYTSREVYTLSNNYFTSGLLKIRSFS